MLRLCLQHADTRHRALLTRAFVRRCLVAALNGPAEFTVRIVNADEGLQLNAGYRHGDHATNVLTFPYAHEPVVRADLVICAPVVEKESKEQGISLLHHYAHLLVHGALHAQGWDHQDDGQAADMQALEAFILATLGVPDPYATRRASRRAASRAK